MPARPLPSRHHGWLKPSCPHCHGASTFGCLATFNPGNATQRMAPDRAASTSMVIKALHHMQNRSVRLRAIVRTVLLTLIAVIPALFSAYCYVHRDRIFPERGTIVLYGRETCGITRMVRDGLSAKGIPYLFADVNIAAINDELRYKLGPKFNEPRYTYPVVHVGGRILLTPTADQVLKVLSAEQAAKERDYATFLQGADPVPHY